MKYFWRYDALHVLYRETSQSLCRLITITLGKWEFSYGRSTS